MVWAWSCELALHYQSQAELEYHAIQSSPSLKTETVFFRFLGCMLDVCMYPMSCQLDDIGCTEEYTIFMGEIWDRLTTYAMKRVPRHRGMHWINLALSCRQDGDKKLFDHFRGPDGMGTCAFAARLLHSFAICKFAKTTTDEVTQFMFERASRIAVAV